jgi:Na+/proline symporter
VVIPNIILLIVFGPVIPSWLAIEGSIMAFILILLPIGMYGTLWRRMAKEKEAGTGKVLGIFLGFALSIFSTIPFLPISASFTSDTLKIVAATMILLGATIFTLGAAGRLDKWFYKRRTQK